MLELSIRCAFAIGVSVRPRLMATEDAAGCSTRIPGQTKRSHSSTSSIIIENKLLDLLY
jgi:hypothetical protein